MWHQLPDTTTQKKLSALRRELSWTHYKLLIRIENPRARDWYMNEAADCGWSTRALERQINSFYYQRLLASRDKNSVRKKTRLLQSTPYSMRANSFLLQNISFICRQKRNLQKSCKENEGFWKSRVYGTIKMFKNNSKSINTHEILALIILAIIYFAIGITVFQRRHMKVA